MGDALHIRASSLHRSKAQRSSCTAEQPAEFIGKKAQLCDVCRKAALSPWTPRSLSPANLLPSEQNRLRALREPCGPPESCCFTPGKHLEPSSGGTGPVSPHFTDQEMEE